MKGSTKNGKVVSGIPHGSMVPPAKLASAFSKQGTLEAKLAVSRDTIKMETARFYSRFKEKYPKAGLQDFARQFDKTVPAAREEYRVHKTYLAIANMFRYMPEVKTGGKAETPAVKALRIAKQKKERLAKQKAAHAQQSRFSRLLCAIQSQIGIPNHLFAQACKVVGFTDTDVESILNQKGGLIDVGLGPYVLATKRGLVPASVATAKQATAAKTAPQPARAAHTSTSAESVYVGKGQYKRVAKSTARHGKPVTIKPADTVAAATASA